MIHEYMLIEPSGELHGEVELEGAKNAVLVIIAALILAPGVSVLKRVPLSADLFLMIQLLEGLGATVTLDHDKKILTVDTLGMQSGPIGPEIMQKMRASILVMGPLLARFGKAEVALPGGCVLGARPIDFHVRALTKMGATADIQGDFLRMYAAKLTAERFVLEYPSVGATENIMMAAVLTPGITEIINAAIEPEVLDLIEVLQKMGAHIELQVPGTIRIEGVQALKPIEHAVLLDRLEAGTLLLAAAVTGGSLRIPDAPLGYMELFLEKLREMGHQLTVEQSAGRTVLVFKATSTPRAVSFRTMPYPGFPTDLQAPMMVAQLRALGTSVIYETVFENRLTHIRELQKMGALITINGPLIATVTQVDALYGAQVIAPDIRASAALIIAALCAEGPTMMSGLHHFRRGYTKLDEKLRSMGAKISIITKRQE